MKNYSPNSRTRGWTLTELLFVMLIMIALAGMIAASIGPVKATVARYRAKAQISMLKTGLADYKAVYGSFPICEDLKDSGNVLYKTLFGDFGGKPGVPDWMDSDLKDKDVKTFVPKLQPAPEALDGNPSTIPKGTTYVLESTDGRLIVVDPWDTQLGYINFRKGHPKVPRGGGTKNPTYDLWSFGNDPTLENEAAWITNWF